MALNSSKIIFKNLTNFFPKIRTGPTSTNRRQSANWLARQNTRLCKTCQVKTRHHQASSTSIPDNWRRKLCRHRSPSHPPCLPPFRRKSKRSRDLRHRKIFHTLRDNRASGRLQCDPECRRRCRHSVNRPVRCSQLGPQWHRHLRTIRL